MSEVDIEINRILSGLPPGYRFSPSDLELLMLYLRRKVRGERLPVHTIYEQDVFQFNPEELSGDIENKRYFFCKGNWDVVNGFRNRANSGRGRWRRIDELNCQIMDPRNNQVIGIKNTLEFYERENSSDGLRRTEWVMDQFCLVNSVDVSNLQENRFVQDGDWIACCIYQLEDEEIDDDDRAVTLSTNNEESSIVPKAIIEISFGDLRTNTKDPSSPSIGIA